MDSEGKEWLISSLVLVMIKSFLIKSVGCFRFDYLLLTWEEQFLVFNDSSSFWRSKGMGREASIGNDVYV